MNKIAGKKPDGTPFLALVLEPGNLLKLQRQPSQPISLRIDEMFPEGVPKKLELDILYSETPVADARELAGMADYAFDERTPASRQKKPHCPECRSVIEQFGVMRSDESPLALVFCPACGCVFGTAATAQLGELREAKPIVRNARA